MSSHGTGVRDGEEVDVVRGREAGRGSFGSSVVLQCRTVSTYALADCSDVRNVQQGRPESFVS